MHSECDVPNEESDANTCFGQRAKDHPILNPLSDAREPPVAERVRGLTPPGSPGQRAIDRPILSPSPDARESAVPGSFFWRNDSHGKRTL